MKHWKELFPYTEIRPQQEVAIEAIINAYNNGKKHFILEAPTGTGKSGIAVTFARYLKENGKRTTIITKTKALQDQYNSEFKDVFDLKGKTNYPCIKREGVVYGSPACEVFVKSKWCRPKGECPYVQRREVWKESASIRMTNFSFMCQCDELVCDGEFKSDCTVIDECHNISEEIISRSTLTLDTKEIRDNIISPFLKVKEELPIDFSIKSLIEEILQFKSSLKASVENELVILNDKLMDLSENISSGLFLAIENLDKAKETKLKKSLSSMKEFGIEIDESNVKIPDSFYRLTEYLNNLYNKFNSVTNSCIGSKFVFEENEDGVVKITPVFASSSANHILLKKADFHLHMSATVGDMKVYMKELGLDENECEVLSLEGVFKKENRPIYYIPLVNFSYNNQENSLDTISSFITEILSKNRGNKGIIHTSSYHYAYEIAKRVRNGRLKIPTDDFTIDDFINSKEDYVLLSPSVFEGYDFKDDLARFQILTKVQYASLGDVYVRKKAELYPRWYVKEAANKLTQSYGRGVRHEDDWCEFFIPDTNFERLLNKDLFPLWFKEAIQEI